MIIESFKNLNKVDERIKINLENNDFINLINLVTGLYQPLNGFCNSEDVNNILFHKKISKKKNWTIPIILSLKSKQKIILKKFYRLQYKNKIVGLIKPNDLFQINKKKFCKKIFSTLSNKHPYVKFINNTNNLFIGGKVFLLKKFLPKDKLIPKYKSEVRNIKDSVIFSTRNVCHLGHQKIHEYILKKKKKLVIAIIINDKNKFNPDLIVKSYMHLKKKLSLYRNINIIKILLPSFFAGPNEAYLQATCFNNLGFKGFVVGRDHAGHKKFFQKYVSQEIFNNLNDLKIKIFKTKEPYICSRCLKVGFRLIDICNCKNTKNYLSLDGKTVKKLLNKKRFKNLEKFLNPYIFSFLKKKYKK
jgi:ATP sulfurylase